MRPSYLVLLLNVWYEDLPLYTLLKRLPGIFPETPQLFTYVSCRHNGTLRIGWQFLLIYVHHVQLNIRHISQGCQLLKQIATGRAIATRDQCNGNGNWGFGALLHGGESSSKRPGVLSWSGHKQECQVIKSCRSGTLRYWRLKSIFPSLFNSFKMDFPVCLLVAVSSAIS